MGLSLLMPFESVLAAGDSVLKQGGGCWRFSEWGKQAWQYGGKAQFCTTQFKAELRHILSADADNPIGIGCERTWSTYLTSTRAHFWRHLGVLVLERRTVDFGSLSRFIW